MSVFGLERSQTSTANKYDHAINLVDTTKPKESPERNTGDDLKDDLVTKTENGTSINRQITKGQGALRKELARRKYAKYQQERDNDAENPVGKDNEVGIATPGEPRRSQESERTGRLRDKIPFRTKRKVKSPKKSEDSFIDVLYENQRGSWFCGIPLYSSNSLLNFDPSPWQTANFQDSPVNITNFQLPDPSWTWDWKTWYVDMSRDVDEEGWEYSFSFNNAYAWHGNHPWLFSFARRRRWLRKRVKIRSRRVGEKRGRSNQAHMLNEEYFTIHAAKRERSRDSSGDRTTTNQSSYLNGQYHDSDEEDDLSEITNISALMIALKKARVDREKISAVKAFISQGGDELFYLADSTPQIMEMFVYQTSRRQLQTHLLEVLDAATSTVSADKEEKGKQQRTDSPPTSDPDTLKRKVDNLLKTIHAAGVHVNDLVFWSDIRARTTSSETDPTNETHALDASEPARVLKEGPREQREDDEEVPVKEEIRGIPRDAHVSLEPRLQFAGQGDGVGDENRAPSAVEKGKGKAE